VAYENLRFAIGQAHPPQGTEPSRAMLADVLQAGLTPTVPTDYQRWKPLHWIVLVPDVMERGGFDAIIGNPPFVTGSAITGALGTNMRDWLVHVLASGKRGNADLVAYFFLRAMALLAGSGTLGLIATKSIAQGKSREVGLDRMVEEGFIITRAIRSRPWPVTSANLEYAAVWGTLRNISDDIPRIADGAEVRQISTLLEPVSGTGPHPFRLIENLGITFEGCKPTGAGFVLQSDEAHSWLEEHPRNEDVLFPYLTGNDLNTPEIAASRWIIDFNDRPESEAKTYPIPYGRVREKVRPERQGNKRKVYRDYWWHYAEKRPGLRKAISTLDEVLVMTRHSVTVMPCRVPTTQVFGDALVVFAASAFSDQAVLSATPHQAWAIKYGSGLRKDPRYTPSGVFATYPRPKPTERLAEIGRTLDTERREIMLRRQLGLTKLYNLVNDPDIADEADADVARMREIHVALDNAVMDAYGWGDVELDHGFHTYRQMTRWTVSPEARVEILDRLLAENHRRAAAQGEAPPRAEDEAAQGGGE
jgi:hypothetical protein